MQCVKIKKFFPEVKERYYLCPCGRVYSEWGDKVLKNYIDKDKQHVIKLYCDEKGKYKCFMVKHLMKVCYNLHKDLDGFLPSINKFTKEEKKNGVNKS